MKRTLFIFSFLLTFATTLCAQNSIKTLLLKDIHLRDVCILPDPVNKTYYMIGSGRSNGAAAVVQYTSKDLVNWEGPKPIFAVTDSLWTAARIQTIWAPELHRYKEKYYLFLTFSTNKLLPEQWLNWRPRVVRASQVLVSDSPTGPFRAFEHHGTTPDGMMTLDGTLYEEDGRPYMVYAHEWVQISNGTIEAIPLKPDLSAADGAPQLLFRANSASWVDVASKDEGCYVTDGPFFYKSKSGKLFMTWSSFKNGKYAVGVAISASGKLAGPWTHDPNALFTDDGGHAMTFKTFTGKLLMVLHTPNERTERPHLFELEDTGETLRMVRQFIP